MPRINKQTKSIEINVKLLPYLVDWTDLNTLILGIKENKSNLISLNMMKSVCFVQTIQMAVKDYLRANFENKNISWAVYLFCISFYYKKRLKCFAQRF